MEAVVLSRKKEQHFFASANTARGFVNYYDEIFSSVPRVWYIKGGPGTGKSYMMKRIATAATQKGYTVLEYHCSSDPTSLDGVLIPEIGFGILDGTAPHAGDPRYPGAGDRLVDVGRFWDERVLCAKRAQIAELMAKKREAYRMVYAGLSAENALCEARRIPLASVIQHTKLTAFAERACKGVQGRYRQRRVCVTDSIGMGGRVHLETLEAAATRIYTVREQYGAGEMVLAALATAAERAGCGVVCSLDPLDPKRLTSVLFVETGELYTLFFTGEAVKEINTARFLDRDALQAARSQLRKLVRAERAVRATTDASFAQIHTLHFALEQIYTSAMDLASASAFLDGVLGDVFV